MTAEEKNATWIGGLSALGSMTKVTKRSQFGVSMLLLKRN